MTTLHPLVRMAAALVGLACLTPVASAHAQAPLTLADALDAALAAHPAVTAADARVLAAEGAGDAARAALLPASALTATLTRFQDPMVVAPLHSLDFGNPPVFDRALLQGQIGAQYTLFDGGARAWRVRETDAARGATRAERGSAEMRVLEESASAYLGIITTRALLDAARARAVALEAERGRAQRHFDAGSSARVELLRAEAVLQEARASEASAVAAAALAERVLARLMGVDAGALLGRPLADVAPRGSAAPVGAEANPTVQQADRAVAAAEARLSEERASRLPSVSIGAGLQDFGTPTGKHVVEWRAGLEVSWPAFTGGARSAAVRRAAAELEASRADLEAARLQVDQEIDAALTWVAEADARVAALEAAVAQWVEVTRIEDLALEAGSGEQRDLLHAEAGLFEARAGHAVARRDAILARVRLARAQGVLSREWILESMEAR